MPFPIIFREDIESLNFAHQLGILYFDISLHTMTVFVSEILLVRTGFLPHLLMVEYNVLCMKYFVDVTSFIPK